MVLEIICAILAAIGLASLLWLLIRLCVNSGFERISRVKTHIVLRAGDPPLEETLRTLMFRYDVLDYSDIVIEAHCPCPQDEQYAKTFALRYPNTEFLRFCHDGGVTDN